MTPKPTYTDGTDSVLTYGGRLIAYLLQTDALGLGTLTDEEIEWMLHASHYYVTAATPADIVDKVSDIKTLGMKALEWRKAERAKQLATLQAQADVVGDGLEGGRLTPLTPTPPNLPDPATAADVLAAMDQYRQYRQTKKNEVSF